MLEPRRTCILGTAQVRFVNGRGALLPYRDGGRVDRNDGLALSRQRSACTPLHGRARTPLINFVRHMALRHKSPYQQIISILSACQHRSLTHVARSSGRSVLGFAAACGNPDLGPGRFRSGRARVDPVGYLTARRGRGAA